MLPLSLFSPMPTDILGTAPYDKGDSLTRITRYCQYWVFGEEYGEPTEEKPEGYHHWQFFIQLTKHRDWKWIHEHLPGIHVEPRKGTCEQALEYCMKDGNFVQGGQVIDRPGQGARSDLEVFVEDSKTMTKQELWIKHPSSMVRYYQTPDRVRADCLPPKQVLTRLVWIFGEPGCGKTLYITQKHPDIYRKPDKSKYWHNYRGHKEVLMDEMNSPEYDYNELLMIGNAGSHSVQVKFGNVEFLAELVYLISNVEPQVAYHKAFLENPGAITRRTTFYRASKGGPHELVLQLVRFAAGNWIDQGDPVTRHVDYDDVLEPVEI